MAAGAAFRQNWPQAGADYRANFTLACAATMFTTSMTQFLIARAIQGTSICFIATVGYVTVQEAFGQTKGIKLMAIITSIVLIAPIIGPLSGAALMHFMHWKVLFAIIAVMGFISFVGLLLAMPETVKRGAVPFSAKSVLRDFRNVFAIGCSSLAQQPSL